MRFACDLSSVGDMRVVSAVQFTQLAPRKSSHWFLAGSRSSASSVQGSLLSGHSAIDGDPMNANLGIMRTTFALHTHVYYKIT